MSLPADSLYALVAWTNPSFAIADAIGVIDTSQLPAAWKAACTSFDWSRARVAMEDGTEIPSVGIAINPLIQHWVVRFRWPGTLASMGLQRVRILPPRSVNLAYAASDPYGSDNVFGVDDLCYHSRGAGDDLTVNGLATSNTGISVGSDSSPIGAATEYSGAGDRADITDPLVASTIGTGTPITVSCLASFANSGGNQVFMGVADQNVADQQFQMQRLSNNLRAISIDGSGDIATTTGVFNTTNTWYHITAVFGSSTLRSAYINGGNKATNTAANSPSGIDRISYGITADSTPGGDNPLTLAECRVLSRAWSDAEVELEANMLLNNATFWGSASAPIITPSSSLAPQAYHHFQQMRNI